MKELIEELKNLEQYDVFINSYYEYRHGYIERLSSEVCNEGEWIKVEDLQKILDKYACNS